LKIQDNIRKEDADLNGANLGRFSKTSLIKPKLTTSPHSQAVKTAYASPLAIYAPSIMFFFNLACLSLVITPLFITFWFRYYH
jgi:hypothetical protein